MFFEPSFRFVVFDEFDPADGRLLEPRSTDTRGVAFSVEYRHRRGSAGFVISLAKGEARAVIMMMEG